MKIELGSKVRDRVTGFEGIAIGRTIWLTGCDNIGVQPAVKDSKLEEVRWFDEIRLEVIGTPTQLYPAESEFLQHLQFLDSMRKVQAKETTAPPMPQTQVPG